jgi:hypothetical protein
MRGVVKRAAKWLSILALELAVTPVVVFLVARIVIASRSGQDLPAEVRTEGNPAAHLEFACEMDTADLLSFFSRQDVIDDLRQLSAGVTLALNDLSAGRADVVRKLNQAGIPVTAWLALPKEQGYYINAANAPEADARFSAFEKWTSDSGLRWAGVGLDIEPTLQEFRAVLDGHPMRLVRELVRRCFDVGSIDRARNAYAALIARMQAAGYRVDTYQFPFLADERQIHSHLLERLAGIVDVRGDREAFMTYTSFNHTMDSALIWEYGQEAQILSVGSTAGDPADKRFGPLNWQEFSHDVLVASHFSPVVGVYSLEGCVRLGFLSRLRQMSWNQPVTIPTEAHRKVIQLRNRIQAALWTGSHLLYFVTAILIVNGWLFWRST